MSPSDDDYARERLAEYRQAHLDVLTRIADALDRLAPKSKYVDITRLVEGNPLATEYKFGSDE